MGWGIKLFVSLNGPTLFFHDLAISFEAYLLTTLHKHCKKLANILVSPTNQIYGTSITKQDDKKMDFSIPTFNRIDIKN